MADSAVNFLALVPCHTRRAACGQPRRSGPVQVLLSQQGLAITADGRCGVVAGKHIVIWDHHEFRE